MAQTGYTPILIYSSSTVSQAPSAGNLTNSTLGSELAINITDGKLFYKDNANAVQVIAWKVTPTTAGGTGLTSYTAGDLLYYATGTTLTKLAIGASTNILTSTGSAPQWTAPSTITVGTATNLAGGVAGSVPYQSGAGATTFLGIGAANTVLTSSGSAPQWSTSLSLAGSVTATAFIPSSSTVPTNGMYLPSSNNLGWATNSSFRMQLGTGGLSINTTTSNAQLTVASSNTGTGVPTSGNSTVWLMNDAGAVTANNGPAITFNARSRTGPTEIQVMAGIKGAKLNANNDEIAGYLAFYTANNSVRTLVEQMRLWDTGGLSLGNTTDPGATNLSVTGTTTTSSLIISKGGEIAAGGTVAPSTTKTVTITMSGTGSYSATISAAMNVYGGGGNARAMWMVGGDIANNNSGATAVVGPTNSGNCVISAITLAAGSISFTMQNTNAVQNGRVAITVTYAQSDGNTASIAIT